MPVCVVAGEDIPQVVSILLMSQQGFDDTDIVAAVEHVRGETVAQRMRRKGLSLYPAFGLALFTITRCFLYAMPVWFVCW